MENYCYSYINLQLIFVYKTVSLFFCMCFWVADTVIHSSFLYMKHIGIKLVMIFLMQFVVTVTIPGYISN
jgi:hypothetical protein